MKKISKILMALTAVPLLASCGAKAQFKNISYERVLTNSEKAALMAKVSAATYERINKMKVESSSKTKTDLRTTDATAKQDVEFFTNGEAQAVGQRKETSKVDGKVVELKEKVTTMLTKTTISSCPRRRRRAVASASLLMRTLSRLMSRCEACLLIWTMLPSCSRRES